MQCLVAAGGAAAHVAVTFTLPSRLYALLCAAYGALFAWLAGRPWGRALLLRAPGVFSRGMFTREGPTPAQVAGTTFAFTNIARGYSRGECGGVAG